MTTRDELIEGMRMIVREGLRTTRTFGPDDWSFQVHDEEAGWTVRDTYAHLTAIAEITPGFLGALGQAGEGQNAAAGVDINALNAQAIAAKAAMTEAELMGAFKTGYEKLVEHIQGMPQDQLDQQRQFGPYQGAVAEIMSSALVLHGLSHIYHAGSRPF